MAIAYAKDGLRAARRAAHVSHAHTSVTLPPPRRTSGLCESPDPNSRNVRSPLATRPQRTTTCHMPLSLSDMLNLLTRPRPDVAERRGRPSALLCTGLMHLNALTTLVPESTELAPSAWEVRHRSAHRTPPASHRPSRHTGAICARTSCIDGKSLPRLAPPLPRTSLLFSSARFAAAPATRSTAHMHMQSMEEGGGESRAPTNSHLNAPRAAP